MGSRAHTAAAACLVAGGVWAGATGAPTAFADPSDSADVAGSGVADDRTGHRADAPHHGTGEDGRNDAEAETQAQAPSADDPEPSADDTEPGTSDTPDEETTARDPADERVDPSRPCGKDGGKDCGPGRPWPWPWHWPHDPDPPGGPKTAGGGNDRPVGVPRPGGPPSPGAGAPVVRPPEDLPFDPDVIDTVPGVGLPAAGSAAPISAPVLTIPVVGAGPGGAATSAGPGRAMPAAPRRVAAEPPPARQPPPAREGAPGSPAVPAGRIGYGETLRSAGTSQLAALAVPGMIGILVLTALGGLLGYRQAKAGQAMRARGTARFMN